MSRLELDLIVYDFDGVMTDNRALVFEDGREAVFVNRSDGLAVKGMKKAGIAQIILSAEKNPVVTARGNKLGIPVLQGIEDKKPALEKYLRENKVDPSRAAYVGNEINDLGPMSLVAWRICPADAHPEVKSAANVVLRAKGGYGVVRELWDLVKGAGPSLSTANATPSELIHE